MSLIRTCSSWATMQQQCWTRRPFVRSKMVAKHMALLHSLKAKQLFLWTEDMFVVQFIFGKRPCT